MQELKARAIELLENGTVNRVLGWRIGENTYDPEPAFFESAESMKDFVYNNFCAANLSKYMIEASKLEGKTLGDVMDALYAKYGYYVAGLKNVNFTSQAQKAACMELLEQFRAQPPAEIGGFAVTAVADYKAGVIKAQSGETRPTGLPRENMVMLDLGDKGRIVLRPSGTEPKIKFYYTAVAPSMEQANDMIARMDAAMSALV